MKKPFDYQQLNSTAIMATPLGEVMQTLKFNVFTADGTPAALPHITEEQATEHLKLLLRALPEELDPRAVLEALLASAELLSTSIERTLSSIHAMGHQVAALTDYDISLDKVHTAIAAYANPEEPTEVTPENSNEVLDSFFVGDKKPN